jgi:molybdate transport system substrate-binding protein
VTLRLSRRLPAYLLALLTTAAHAGDTITVFAAASLTDALDAINKRYQTVHPVVLHVSYASSGTLARQIDAGAPADIFASADRKWVDYLTLHGHTEAGSRYELLGNTLVLIAPKSGPSPAPVRFDRGFDFGGAFKGKLCTGETGSVPAGIYARQALQYYGWWDASRGRIVGTEDVRGALAFVERGDCALGIVYRTDALVSDKVAIVGTFPEASHDPIVYPFTLIPGASLAARQYFRYLQGDAARAIFMQYGFTVQ